MTRTSRTRAYLVAVFSALLLLLLISLPGSGIQAGSGVVPTWQAPSDVEAHVRAAGLQLLGKEGLAEHIHPHLAVSVNGKALTVPAEIGINTAAHPTTYAQIHTHDTSGIIHVESPTPQPFYLGQVFEEWGVPLSGNQVGSYVDGQHGVRIAVFVDGAPYKQNPMFLQLANKQQISIAVTTDGSAPRAAATFVYPAGY